ncbi:MAG: hypothetical protein RJB60_130 [Pseudomonadota bacterium]|jgi:hypothetical protein
MHDTTTNLMQTTLPRTGIMKKIAFTLMITCAFIDRANAESSATSPIITPLSANQALSGVGCMIVDLKGKTLTDGAQIIVNSKIQEIKKAALTKKSKKWLGNSLEVTYTLGKGSLLEEATGFAPGKGPKGTLSITANGNKLSMPAREVCNGDV